MMRSFNDAFNEQLTMSLDGSGTRTERGGGGGIKDKLACFEKTIKENNEAGVTSGMYINNMLTKGGQNTRTSRGGLDCTFSKGVSGSQFPRRSSTGTATTVSCSSPELEDWTGNSSVHSGFTITDRTSDSDDDSSISCDSFGEGDDDDIEVPSIVEDINSNRSKRNNNNNQGSTAAGTRKILVLRRRPTGTTKASRSHANGIPETIFESSGDSRHSRKSKSSQKSGKRSSSRSRDSRESQDDSDADSFC